MRTTLYLLCGTYLDGLAALPDSGRWHVILLENTQYFAKDSAMILIACVRNPALSPGGSCRSGTDAEDVVDKRRANRQGCSVVRVPPDPWGRIIFGRSYHATN